MASWTLSTFEIEAPKVVQALARYLELAEDALCFCGTGEQYVHCCHQNSSRQYALFRSAFEALSRYQDSQGGTVKEIPQGLFLRLHVASARRLSCLYPGCPQRPVSCHLIPKSALRATFGDHCLEYRPTDRLKKSGYVRTGNGRAGTAKVFCSQHDAGLFKELDSAQFHLASPRQHFLVALKALAFSLRRTQVLLGIDCQVEVLKPFWIFSHPTNRDLKHAAGDVTYFHEQYLRFKLAHDTFVGALAAFEKERWEYFHCTQRTIATKTTLFFASVMNPSHDLENNRTNDHAAPIYLSCTIWPWDGALRIAFAHPEGPSRTSYATLTDQLRTIDDETLIVAVNNLLTANAEYLLLPCDVAFDDAALRKIKILRAKAAQAVKRSSDEVLTLTDPHTCVPFIH